MFLPWSDELVWFFDTVVPGDLLCCYVVMTISDLSRAQVHVVCVEYI